MRYFLLLATQERKNQDSHVLLDDNVGIGSDYLQKTKIPTFHFQDSLPRLPIPDIEKTAQVVVHV
jgi:hypothetical protein